MLLWGAAHAGSYMPTLISLGATGPRWVPATQPQGEGQRGGGFFPILLTTILSAIRISYALARV